MIEVVNVCRFTHYEGTLQHPVVCETLIRVDQIAVMPNFREVDELMHDWERERWLGVLILNSGHRLELIADLPQWNALAQAMRDQTHD